MKFRRAYLTLLELMLVIAILGIIAGFIAVNAAKAWKEQRFRTEVSLIVDQLRLAQNLMLIFNSNVQVVFLASPEGIEYYLSFDTPLPKHWTQEINRPHEKLKTVRVVNFEDKLETEDNLVINQIKNGISVKFLSGGSKMSRGIMRISTSEEDNVPNIITRYVCLPGYPAPITSQGEFPMECSSDDLQAFEKQLTMRTKEEVELNVKDL